MIRGTEYIRCKLYRAAQHEMVTRFEDFLSRRSKIALIARRDTIRRASWRPAAFRSETMRKPALRSTLTSKQLKVKKKAANIAGLQLSDLMGHPVRQDILREEGHLPDNPQPFAAKLTAEHGMKSR